MRTLIVVPIIHTEHDMGSLREAIQQQYFSRYGGEQWAAHLESINQVWNGIRQMIAALALPYRAVRLYQDGLARCGKEAGIVNDVAAQGSKNHQLLVDLMAQGAQLMGTEDPVLLLQEYQLQQGAFGAAPPDPDALLRQSRELLARRDHFIAEQINATLLADEVGLLFVGMAHAVGLLAADILTRHLLPSLRQRQVNTPC
jgi:hypothetical protein